MRFRTLLVGLLTLVPLAAFATPEVGAKAPDFNFQGVDGATYRLADYVGGDAAKAPDTSSTSSPSLTNRKGVVIAWFPKAFTAG